jgi:microcystin-dependent protein
MQPYVGQIELLPFNFAPQDWAACEGQQLQISENDALFQLIGTTYGGDGQTTFALPDLRGKEPTPDSHYCIAIYGVFPSHS